MRCLRSRAHYEDDGHAHHVIIDGAVGALRTKALYDDRKSLENWVIAQRGYASQEVQAGVRTSENAQPPRSNRPMEVARAISNALLLPDRTGLILDGPPRMP